MGHSEAPVLDALASRADLLGTTSPSVLLYAGIDGWRRQTVLHGHLLMIRALEPAAFVYAGDRDRRGNARQ